MEECGECSKRPPKRTPKKQSRCEKDHGSAPNKKVAHNAVECRRKQRISSSIEVLSNMIDSCNCGKETRAEVLQKAVNKIQELETSNKELQDLVDKRTKDRSEELLQQELALLLVDHIYLTLSLISHQHKEPVSTADHATNNKTDLTTPNNERLGFGVESLLDPSSYNDRASLHRYTEYNSTGLASRDELNCDTIWHSSSSSLSHGNSYFQQQYHSSQAELWYPNQYQRFANPAPPTIPYLAGERPSLHAPPVWRPYHDGTSPSQPPVNQSGFTGQAGSSFLVGQLLEHVIQ